MPGPLLPFTVEGPVSAPAVVLVHGSPDRSAAFNLVLAELDHDHVRLVRYDRRGYGRSLAADPAASLADHADDLLALIDHLGRPCVVVAHSFGSNPSMLAAVARPGAFAALGVWEPPMVWLPWWPQSTKDYDAEVAAAPEPAQAAEDFNRRMLGDAAWEALDPTKREQRRAEGRAFCTDMAAMASTPFAAVDVEVPLLVGYGAQTAAEHVRGAHDLAADAPNARLFCIEGAGHFANRTHPADFARFVEATVDLAASTMD